MMALQDKRSRRPLFPGRSCFPLSPSSKNCLTEMTDQLNIIFAVVGTPTLEEIEMLDAGSDVKGYLRHLQAKPAIDLQERYAHAPAEAIELLGGLLRFTAQDRTTLDEALAHSFFEGYVQESVSSAESLEAAALQASLAFDATLDDDDDDMDLEQPSGGFPQLIRSESLLAAKELLQLQLETKYDKRNHNEAVEKLNGLFRAEISGFHKGLGILAKSKRKSEINRDRRVLGSVDEGKSEEMQHEAPAVPEAQFVDALSPAQAS